MKYGPFTDAASANACLMELYQEQAAGKAIVARGQVRIGSILPGFCIVVHKMTPSQRDLTAMGGKGDIYGADYMKAMKDVAGLRTVSSERIDNGSVQHCRTWRVVLEGLDLVGRMRRYEGTYEYDLSDGSPRAEDTMGKPAKPNESEERRSARCWRNLCELRTHVTSRAETGAMSRAVVDGLSLKRSLNELKNKLIPIYIPTLDFHAETAAPEVRAAMSMGAVQAMLGVYGAPPPAPELRRYVAPAVDRDPEPDAEIPYDAPDGTYDPPAESEELPPPSAPPQTQSPFVTEAMVDQLRAWECWDQESLKALGWSGEGKVPVEVYERALAEREGVVE